MLAHGPGVSAQVGNAVCPPLIAAIGAAVIQFGGLASPGDGHLEAVALALKSVTPHRLSAVLQRIQGDEDVCSS